MKCGKCGGTTSVMNTRHSGERRAMTKYSFINGRFTMRNLICLECGHKENTVEVEEIEIFRLKTLRAAMAAIKKALYQKNGLF